MTAADYTPYLQGGRELGQQQGQNIGGINGTGTSLPLSEYLYSNNSLNITTQQPVEKGAQTPQQVDTPNSLKSSKTTQLGTPTAMTDLLAMLDDNTAFSDMVQQQEERQWDIERHRNKFTTQLSSATTSGDTTTTTDLSPQVLMQQEVPMNMVSRSASAGLLEAVGDKQTPLMPLQTEQQFINPNLLNNGGGANSSLFVDDGFLEEPVGACGTANQLIIDEVALSPDIQRRMSEVVTGSIPQQNHSRGSISHQIDFWNLSNDRQSISSGHSTSGRTANNSIDLMSFKKSPTPNVATAGTSITNTSATTLPTVTAGSTNTLPTTTNSSKSNSANNLNGAAPPSVFKIDNELTQLLNDYNIDFSAPSKPSHTPTTRLRASSYVPHTKTNTVTTSSSTGNILSSAAAAAAAAAVATSATSAIPSVSTSRRSNSVSEPQNRVQKQRTSVSLIDGSNPVIMDKLYGDVNNISKFSQWENAIISDEEDHEEKSTNRQLDPKVTLATATVGSKFISPAMLNQDLLENKSFEVRNTSTISTNGISASTRRKRASIPKGPRGTSSKSSSPLEEEEKPFKCQECTKAFRRSEHLKRHIRSVHSTDRPFPCTYCDKKFSRSDNLSQHLKTHRKHGDIKDVLPAASLKKG